MKREFRRISSCILPIMLMVIVLIGTGCKKEETLPPNHVIGTIVEINTMCAGEIVLIEVEKPKSIGLTQTIENGNKYYNLIGVPYFSKIGLDDTIPMSIGTELNFEFRELTLEEETLNLFSPIPPPACKWEVSTVAYKKVIITKVFSHN